MYIVDSNYVPISVYPLPASPCAQWAVRGMPRSSLTDGRTDTPILCLLCYGQREGTVASNWQTTVPDCQEGVVSTGECVCDSALYSCDIVTDIDEATIGIYRVMQENTRASKLRRL